MRRTFSIHCSRDTVAPLGFHSLIPGNKISVKYFPLEWTNFRSLNDFSLSSINFYCGQPQGVSCIRWLWCQKSTDMEHVWEKLVFQIWKLNLDPAGVCVCFFLSQSLWMLLMMLIKTVCWELLMAFMTNFTCLYEGKNAPENQFQSITLLFVFLSFVSNA